MDKQKIIAEIMNGETSVYVRCAAELGYDRGYARAIQDAAKVAEFERQQDYSDAMTAHNIWVSIRALAPEGGEKK